MKGSHLYDHVVVKTSKFEDHKYMEMVMKLDKFLCVMFLFAVLALTIRKPHPFVQNEANQKVSINLLKTQFVNRGQKFVHGHSQVDMKCDVIAVLDFEVLRFSQPVI